MTGGAGLLDGLSPLVHGGDQVIEMFGVKGRVDVLESCDHPTRKLSSLPKGLLKTHLC